MSQATLDVVGIGNAIVDVIAYADHDFLQRYGMVKGSMALIDEARADEIYNGMGSTTLLSGGSAGNTVAGVAMLGGKTGYIGKVRDDILGRSFRHDITAVGVTFPTPSATDGPATARSFILVTPDAQRTMNTFLGACVNLGPDDIDEALIRSAQITYMEGYLYDKPLAQAAFHKAADVAHAGGRKVGLSLSDTFCVERHHAAFTDLVKNRIDVLFANEAEICALFGTATARDAVQAARAAADLTAITCSERGSIIVTKDDVIEVAAAPVAQVVDTTGAGDLYAAGFLYGLTAGAPLAECGRMGSLAASHVLTHVGARPQSPLEFTLALD